MPSLRTLLFNLLVFLLVSCRDSGLKHNEVQKVDKRKWAITLKDSLTKITIELPNRFDTMLVWTHYSCGIPYYKIRIQEKALPIHEEGGFFDTQIPKQKSQITFVQQTPSSKTNVPTRQSIERRHWDRVKESENDPQAVQTQFDSIVIVNNQTYSVFANCLRYQKEQLYMQTLETEIFTKRGTVKLIIEQTDKNLPMNRMIFVQASLDIIKSLRVDDGI